MEERLSLSIVKIAHKAVFSKSNSYLWPEYLRLEFKKPNERVLRANAQATNKIKSSNINGTFAYTAAKVYNDLPCQVRKIDEYKIFCNKAKLFYIDKAYARVLSSGM